MVDSFALFCLILWARSYEKVRFSFLVRILEVWEADPFSYQVFTASFLHDFDFAFLHFAGQDDHFGWDCSLFFFLSMKKRMIFSLPVRVLKFIGLERSARDGPDFTFKF